MSVYAGKHRWRRYFSQSHSRWSAISNWRCNASLLKIFSSLLSLGVGGRNVNDLSISRICFDNFAILGLSVRCFRNCASMFLPLKEIGMRSMSPILPVEESWGEIGTQFFMHTRWLQRHPLLEGRDYKSCISVVAYFDHIYFLMNESDS